MASSTFPRGLPYVRLDCCTSNFPFRSTSLRNPPSLYPIDAARISSGKQYCLEGSKLVELWDRVVIWKCSVEVFTIFYAGLEHDSPVASTDERTA